MRTVLTLLLMSFFTQSVNSQTVNNATVNLQGANQYVNITQSSAGHTANVTISGDSVSVIANQSGNTPQSFSLSVSCGSTCPNSPYIINQY